MVLKVILISFIYSRRFFNKSVNLTVFC